MDDNVTLMNPRIPVIGLQRRQVKHIDVRVIEVVMCDCGNPDPIVIPGFDRAGFCPKCKTKLIISKLEFANVNGNVTMSVQVAKWNGPMSAASRDLEVGLSAEPESSREM